MARRDRRARAGFNLPNLGGKIAQRLARHGDVCRLHGAGGKGKGIFTNGKG